jgi:hypothetical protein
MPLTNARQGSRSHCARGRGAARALAAGLAMLLAAACDGAGSSAATGPIVGVGGGRGGGTIAPALVGRWSRYVFLDDGYGGLATSETSWDFSADSIATRALVTSGGAWAYPLVSISTARWRTEGNVVVVRYVSPDTGTVRFRWRVERRTDGDLLFLDETAFARVPR